MVGCVTERLTASKLRENIYRVLDHVLQTGTPVEIERKGRILRIVPANDDRAPRLVGLQEHPGAITGDPEDLVHLDWSAEWRP